MQGRLAIISVASCYQNRDKLRPCGPPWPECDFFTLRRNAITVYCKVMKVTLLSDFVFSADPLHLIVGQIISMKS